MIGILIDRLNVGGVEKIAIEEVRALRDLGEDACLVVLRKKSVVKNPFPDLLKGVPIIYLDERLPKMLRLSFRFPVFNFFSFFHITYPFLLPFVVKRKEFDYLIVHGTYTCLSAISFKLTRGIKFSTFIWDPISYILDRVYSKSFLAPVMWIFKKMANLLDRIIVNSTEVVLVGGDAHNKLIHAINKNKQIRVIYPSVHPLKTPKKKNNYIMVITAWKRGKSPEYLLELMRELPNMHIKMVGKWLDPDYKREFEALIDSENLAEKIEIVGEVNEAELSDYYARATALLQTNDDRGFGMPAMEAAGNGTTFIIPKGQGVGALFTEGVHGFYTKEKNTKQIVPILKNIINDDQKAKAMGRSAWEEVRANYSWKQHAQQLLEVVNKI